MDTSKKANKIATDFQNKLIAEEFIGFALVAKDTEGKFAMSIAGTAKQVGRLMGMSASQMFYKFASFSPEEGAMFMDGFREGAKEQCNVTEG